MTDHSLLAGFNRTLRASQDTPKNARISPKLIILVYVVTEHCAVPPRRVVGRRGADRSTRPAAAQQCRRRGTAPAGTIYNIPHRARPARSARPAAAAAGRRDSLLLGQAVPRLVCHHTLGTGAGRGAAARVSQSVSTR